MTAPQSLPWRDMLVKINGKGWGWKGIGRELGVNADTARHFAHGGPSLFVTFERGCWILGIYSVVCPREFKRRIRPMLKRLFLVVG